MSEFQIMPGRPPKQEFRDRYLAYEQRTVSTVAVGLASIPSAANKAIIVVEDATIRWRGDGTSPTSTVGNKSFVNSTIILQDRQEILDFEAIRQGSTDANLSVNYYERA